MITKFKCLFFKVLITYLLYYLGDFLFSLYNVNYIYPEFEIKFIFILIGIFLLPNKTLQLFILLTISLAMFFEFLNFQYFGSFIQPIGFYQIIFNLKEVFYVFSEKIYFMIIPFIIILLISIPFLYIVKIKTFKSNVFAFTILILIYVYSSYYTELALNSNSGKLWHADAQRIMPMEGVPAASNFMRSLNYFLFGILPYKINNDKINNFKEIPKLKQSLNIEDNNIILIIGESLRANRLGILGYEKQTTPNLSKINNLFSKTIFSAGTMTKVSIPSILNRVKYPGSTYQIMKEENNLFKMAKKTGYETFFYSWQQKSSLKILKNFIGINFIDNFKYKEGIVFDSSFVLGDHDMNLLNIMKKINFNSNKKFIILNQRGSHEIYADQYPERFDIFEDKYDNTVLYTDFFLSELIHYLEEVSKKPTYIIYTSDHGELLGENGKYGHGWFFKEVYNVPFLFYKINSKKDFSVNNVKSHFDVSNLISSLLGYVVNIQSDNTIYVNGSDIDALAGYLTIKVDDFGKELSNIEVR